MSVNQASGGCGESGAAASIDALRASEERLALATEAAHIGVWDWDLVANTFVYSAIAKDICGLPMDQDVTYDDVLRVTHPDDLPVTLAQFERAIDPAIQDASRYEYRVLRPDGDVRWVLAHGRAMFENRDGKVLAVRYIGSLQDITERRQLEGDLAERDVLLGSMLDAAELFIFVAEIVGDRVDFLLVNKATADFCGIPAGAGRVAARDTSLSADQADRLAAALRNVWNAGAPTTVEYAFPTGPRARWYLGTCTPLPPGPTGAPRLSLVAVDVTDRRMADERQKLLMREVDHRAKNALAVVQAVVQLTRENDPQAFRRAVIGRVGAVARAHSLLAEDRWSGVDLERLLAEELAPYRTDRPTRIVMRGPAYSLAPAAAQSIALILHELATNAAKYGALRSPEGSLDVIWTIDSGGGLDLAWAEDVGSGADAAAPPTQKGFGFNLLERTVTGQLGGQWSADWARQGLRFEMRLPGGKAADDAALQGSSRS